MYYVIKYIGKWDVLWYVKNAMLRWSLSVVCPECGVKVRGSYEEPGGLAVEISFRHKHEVLAMGAAFLIIEMNPELDKEISLGYKGLFEHKEGMWFIGYGAIFVVFVSLILHFLRLSLRSYIYEGEWDSWCDVMVAAPLCLYGAAFAVMLIYQLLTGTISVSFMIVSGVMLLTAIIYFFIERKIRKIILSYQQCKKD